MSPSRSTAFNDRPPAAVVGMLLGGLIAGCGARDPAVTQTAARVNQDEITVHQIGAAVATPSLPPEQVLRAEREALERLIDRQLAVQKAADLKLDREPKVVQAIEAARLDIIARAYADRLTQGIARPTAAEVRQYYDTHPALFRDRKVYTLTEFTIEADARQLEALEGALPGLRGAEAVAARLREGGVKFASASTTRAAEQLPLPLLQQLAPLAEGEALLQPARRGSRLLLVNSSRLEPVDEVSAAPAIEQFLLNERKRKLLADDAAALRAAARIDYHGRFAATPGPSSPAIDDAAASGAPRATAANGIDASTVNKGLGLK